MDRNGITPLMYAATLGHVDICQLLLEAAADPVLKNLQGRNALDLADAAGHDTVKALLQVAIAARVPDLISMDGNKQWFGQFRAAIAP